MNDLPELPKQIKHQEAIFGLQFREWLRKNNRLFLSCSFELKHSRLSDSLPFDAVSVEQVAYASKIEGNGVLVRVDGQKGEPDYLWLAGAPAYVAVRYPTFFCIIRMYDFVYERNMSKRKSLSSERARQIAKYVV